MASILQHRLSTPTGISVHRDNNKYFLIKILFHFVIDMLIPSCGSLLDAAETLMICGGACMHADAMPPLPARPRRRFFRSSAARFHELALTGLRRLRYRDKACQS
eukprot:scaffold654708_cov103-Prasinocladus_malaysianus.AAC.1